MTPLSATDIASIVSAVTDPITANLMAILTVAATVAGVSLVVKYFKKSAK